jgi:hypothetical protein
MMTTTTMMMMMMIMGSVHARGDTFLTFGLKALTETNTSRLATGGYSSDRNSNS